MHVHNAIILHTHNYGESRLKPDFVGSYIVSSVVNHTVGTRELGDEAIIGA